MFYNDVADVALTYEQGENIYVEGSLQQRKFTPTDGVSRTLHEVHVKSCHVVAASRTEPRVASPEGVQQDLSNDAAWPV